MNNNYELTEEDRQKIRQMEVILNHLEQEARKLETLVKTISAGGDSDDLFFIDNAIKKSKETK
jgi:hypothetical protein